ncbi:hypothetical protein GCM10009760_48660 [Kitasatospora kazusensis]|uniref:Uncharacterized protein n=1 Tax=Kitasatospora kazusensis TaxID=407974 RepID=A0ABN3A316_9ACTN
MKWQVNFLKSSQRSVLSDFACFVAISGCRPRVGASGKGPNAIHGSRCYLDRIRRAGMAAPVPARLRTFRHRGYTAGEFAR